MKRTALILLMAIYLLSCVGMGITRIFCCGKLIGVTLSYGGLDNISKKPAKKDDCCKKEKQSFQIKDTHLNVSSLVANHPVLSIIPSLVIPNNKIAVTQLRTNIIYSGNAPPGRSDIPVYTLNCTYRI